MSAPRNVALGIFLVGGFFLFAAGLFWIGDRRQLFNDNVDLYAEFANVSGLSRGARVRVSGLDAGEVTDILVPRKAGEPFRVKFRAAATFQPILRADSVATIQNDGLVGSKFLQIEAGTDAAPEVAAGGQVPAREPVEISDLLEQASATVKNANKAVSDVRNGITETVKAVLVLNRETTDLIDGVGKTVDKFANTGLAIASDVNTMVANVRNGEGSIGKLLTDDALYDQIRGAARQGENVVNTFKAASDDLKTITTDLRSRDFATKFEHVADSVENLATESLKAVRTLTGPEGGAGGIVSEVRQTLSSANQTMANFEEGSQALKRNFLFRGFFNKRGFYDLDDVTVRDYTEGKFLVDRQRVSEWLETVDIFAAVPNKGAQVSEGGKRKLDLAMASFLRYSKNDPLIVEAWAGPGSDPALVLRARERAVLVSDYLVKRFGLKPNYVAIMPMNAAAAGDGKARDGVGLVLFAPKPARK